MKRVKANTAPGSGPQQVVSIKRVAATTSLEPGPAGQSKVSRVKAHSGPTKRVVAPTGRVYEGGFTKDSNTGFFYKNGEFYKQVDGAFLKIWPDGVLKDQKTATHVCWFGKVTKRPTEEDYKAAELAIHRCLMRTMPHWYYDSNGQRIHQCDEDGQMIYPRVYV